MNHWERLTILRRLRYTKIHGGGLVLTPWDNEKWIPGQDRGETITGTEAEDWTRAFNENIVGTDYAPSVLPPALLKEYYERLQEFQLDFWKEFHDQIFAVVSVDYLDEAEAKEEKYEKKRAAAIEHYKAQHMSEEAAQRAAEEAVNDVKFKDERDEERRQEERIMWAMRERLAREAGETLHELEDAERERLPRGTNAADARRAREEYVKTLNAKKPEAPEVLHELAEAEREEFAGEYDHPRSTKQEIRAAILRAEEGREAGENSEA